MVWRWIGIYFMSETEFFAKKTCITSEINSIYKRFVCFFLDTVCNTWRDVTIACFFLHCENNISYNNSLLGQRRPTLQLDGAPNVCPTKLTILPHPTLAQKHHVIWGTRRPIYIVKYCYFLRHLQTKIKETNFVYNWLYLFFIRLLIH